MPDDEEFEARVDDLAFKMQTEAPAVFDIWWESTKTLEMCAVGKPPARRLRAALSDGSIPLGLFFFVARDKRAVF